MPVWVGDLIYAGLSGICEYHVQYRECPTYHQRMDTLTVAYLAFGNGHSSKRPPVVSAWIDIGE
jgi:hypothetical protein